ncbi:non-heme iron oxygenase ferredoxin subunit [Nocardioides sp. B-3]|uniref:non-heme iron oxygenase ferredoxin subunit n=1 Tax=Nocardioides sp. B-3 TaxID=2895565 RepID=UPI0021534506|nr:non-heme iron oxygenase ferredoxin subunit [Nocardioides sp. B-3]UUZ59519.1 non-heme iron oxygenase ferredoxin subunit [Nocardioides sp. B-3]
MTGEMTEQTMEERANGVNSGGESTGADDLVWIDACLTDDLPAGEMRALESDPPVAVYNVEGEFFSTADTCTHMKSSLNEGYLDGDQVECALHMATFCVRSGKATSLPATLPLRTFDTRVAGNQLQVSVPRAWVSEG